ncbi:MAG: hypothetical protein E5X51_24980 [Mesorhizobium sp.]|uniref:hypothetical protein n=1 Tax=Mesorhizobium sp. TaxID=1871066 RepID=UPI00120590EB|nr:hypothetical protein [Mesorhizobium sp.]TIQ18565.1 MAG: hypothetical protein E5X51_24980 [Mesorhizobium sp.]
MIKAKSLASSRFALMEKALSMILIPIGFLLLLTSCGSQESTLRTAIMFSNTTVSYPIWAGIMAGEKDSSVLFIDLNDGSRRQLSRKNMYFNSIGKMNGHTKEFLISAKGDTGYTIYKYNYDTEKLTPHFSDEGTLNDPFQLGDNICALHPNLKTEKGIYDFSLRCSGNFSGAAWRLTTHDVTISGNGKTSFLEGRDGWWVHELSFEIGNLVVKKYEIKTEFRPLLFYFKSDLYFRNRCHGCEIILNKLTDGKFIKTSDENIKTLKRILSLEADDISYVDDNITVYTSVDYENYKLTISTMTTKNGSSKDFVVDTTYYE